MFCADIEQLFFINLATEPQYRYPRLLVKGFEDSIIHLSFDAPENRIKVSGTLSESAFTVRLPISRSRIPDRPQTKRNTATRIIPFDTAYFLVK